MEPLPLRIPRNTLPRSPSAPRPPLRPLLVPQASCRAPSRAQTYTLQTQTLAPTFSPVPTTYATPQTVTISDATSGATIYYTLDGSTPTTSSTKYTGPITISTTTTLKSIATAAGLSASPVSSGLYTITSGGSTINFSSGFSTAQSSMTFNGSTGLDDTRLQLTSGLTYQAGSAFYNTPVNIQSFTTDFALQLSNAGADGITFTIQGVGPTALGPAGGGLGYGPDATSGSLELAKASQSSSTPTTIRVRAPIPRGCISMAWLPQSRPSTLLPRESTCTAAPCSLLTSFTTDRI